MDANFCGSDTVCPTTTPISAVATCLHSLARSACSNGREMLLLISVVSRKLATLLHLLLPAVVVLARVSELMAAEVSKSDMHWKDRLGTCMASR